MLTNIKNRPLYLHFLDRELRRAENANFSDFTILEYIIISTISSLNYCYIGASILFESNDLYPISTNLILELEKIGFIKVITNEHSFEEFIESRRHIYSHAASRYPMYFNDYIKDLWPTKPALSGGSTTQILRTNFISYLDTPSNGIVIPKEYFHKSILKRLEKKLTHDRNKAITLDLFLTQKQLEKDSIRRNSGRLVSYFYTKRYLDLFHGELLCNIPNLTFYDQLSSDSFSNNIIILKTILNCLMIPDFFIKDNTFQQTLFIKLIDDNLFRYFQIELFSFIQGLKELYHINKFSSLFNLQKYIESLFDNSQINSSLNHDNFLYIIYSKLYSVISRISNNLFTKAYNMTKSTLSTTKKVLIVTATTTEAKKVLHSFKKNGATPTPLPQGKLTFWNFGVMGNSEIHMFKIGDMGSLKPSGSGLSINDAIQSLSPDYVIMAGIAFGLKKDRQKIGNILVSRDLQNYESQKQTETKIIPRGYRIPAGATLLNRFDNSSLIYEKTDVELGFIISGDTLVDKKEFVDELISFFPEAIGGEMEGTGLQSSCHRNGIEWILIKGICDWGFDKQNKDKQRNQEVAIDNVCEYLIFTLSNFDF